MQPNTTGWGKDMDSHCYISQLSQAEAGRYAVEHLRQNRGRCLGSTYWQVNDNWPVASWSSIDSLGNWKALHYAMKRAYAPVLLSCREEGHSSEVYVSTEGKDGFEGQLYWALKNLKGEVIREGNKKVSLPPCRSLMVESLDFSAELKDGLDRERYLSLSLKGDHDSKEYRVCTWFVRYKMITLRDPKLVLAVKETEKDWEIQISSSGFAKFVEVDLKSGSCLFSDNYFDMDPGETRSLFISKEHCPENPTENLTLRSLKDTY